MKIKYYIPTLIILILNSLVLSSHINAQIDSTNIADSLTSIGDSLIVNDSVIVRLPFLSELKDENDTSYLSTYELDKRTIDRIDYRFSGDLLKYLPFSNLLDQGYTGAPSEAKIFSYGNGNISLINDGYSINNKWNNSSNLNRIQTEGISNIFIAPITSAFLYGFENNSSAIVINSLDTLKSLPISRIRYVQAPNEDASIDAFFSAKVMPNLALSFRVTNNGSASNYINSEFSGWKVNIKGIYKLRDSLYVSLKYIHLKLDASLNGGINVIDNTTDIYSTQSDVIYSSMTNLNSMNLTSSSIYGNFTPNSYSKISITHQENSDILKRNVKNSKTDSTRIFNYNNYKALSATVLHKILYNNFDLNIQGGIESINFDLDDIDYNKNQTNYYSSVIVNYNLFNNTLTPSIYGKYSNYIEQKSKGFGLDVKYNPFNWVKFIIGYSNYEKPYGIIEIQSLDKQNTQTLKNVFASIEFRTRSMSSSISYFNTVSSNSPIPIFNARDIELNTTNIVYEKSDKVESNGFNTNVNIKLWKLLANANFNYYTNKQTSVLTQDVKYNLTTGLYYVDTLFNSNLDLKTGITFHLYDNSDYRIYDFQKIRSASYFKSDNGLTPFEYYDINSDPYRIDLFFAGRIQDSATLYLVYENILGNKFYVLPYYPMPKGGLRIGVSWDFEN